MCASFFNSIPTCPKRIEITKLLQMIFGSAFAGFSATERIFRSFDSVVSQPGHTSVINSNLLSCMGFNGQTQV
jgi:hypothetical protein